MQSTPLRRSLRLLGAAAPTPALATLAALFAADAATLTGGLDRLDPSGWLRLLSDGLATGGLLWLALAWATGLRAALRPGRRSGGRWVPTLIRRVAAIAVAVSLGAPLAAQAGPVSRPVSVSVRGDGTSATPLPDPGLAPPRPATRQSPPPTQATERHTVRPGDTLWSIAASTLPGDAPPARIATEWPRWFAANRQVLDDPDFLTPGQVLTAPTPERTLR